MCEDMPVAEGELNCKLVWLRFEYINFIVENHALVDRHRQNSIAKNVDKAKIFCTLRLLQYLAEYNQYQTETVRWLLCWDCNTRGRTAKALGTTLIVIYPIWMLRNALTLLIPGSKCDLSFTKRYELNQHCVWAWISNYIFIKLIIAIFPVC